MKKLILIAAISTFLIACTKEKEPEVNTQSDSETKKEWAERNKSDLDLENHKSKGF